MRSWTVRTLVVFGLVLAGCTSESTEVSPAASVTADDAGVSPAASATVLPAGAYVPLASPGDDSLEKYVLILTGDGYAYNLMNGGSLVEGGNYSVDGDELTWETDGFYSFCEGGQATYTWVLDDGTLQLTPKGVDGCEERALLYSNRFELLGQERVFEYQATFGEEFTLGDGIWVTVSEPVEFTPSEGLSRTAAMPIWGSVDLEDWDHFVRATVTWRNESSGVAGPRGVNVEDGQQILDEASGLVDMEEMFRTALEDGEEVSYDFGFGVADPADVQVNVTLISGGWTWPGVDASVTFTS